MASCRSCGQTITWALTKTGRKNPMEVDARGLFVLRWDRNARDTEAVLASEVTVRESEPRYTSHFATCHRRRAPEATVTRDRFLAACLFVVRTIEALLGLGGLYVLATWGGYAAELGP